eukprot:346432-Rhodomonas_salina.1
MGSAEWARGAAVAVRARDQHPVCLQEGRQQGRAPRQVCERKRASARAGQRATLSRQARALQQACVCG